MSFEEFKASLNDTSPPAMSPYLTVLWHDGKEEWHAAHDIAQDINSKEGAWLHAYLHRKEGDRSNASYWYSRAGKPYPTMTLAEEWETLVRAFL